MTITVGELVNVPSPNDPINALHHQEVANRVAHRFATVQAMNAWGAANGSLAFVHPTLYLRQSGAWVALAPQSNLDAVNANLTNAINGVQGNVNNTNANLATYPAGLLAHAFSVGAITLTTSTQVLCQVSWSADPSRYYRIIGDVPRIDAGGAQHVSIQIEDGVGTDFRLAIHSFAAAGDRAPIHLECIRSGLTGPQTYRLAGNTLGGTATVQAGANNMSNAMITLEDCGAV